MSTLGSSRAGLPHARAARHTLTTRTASPGGRVAHETHYCGDGTVMVCDYVDGVGPDGEPAVRVTRLNQD